MSRAQTREGERAGEGAEEGGECHKLKVKLSKQPVRDMGIKPQQELTPKIGRTHQEAEGPQAGL